MSGDSLHETRFFIVFQSRMPLRNYPFFPAVFPLFSYSPFSFFHLPPLIPILIHQPTRFYPQVKCSQVLCARTKKSSLSFAETARMSFEYGPNCIRKYATTFGVFVNILVCFVQYETAVVYTLYIATSSQQVGAWGNGNHLRGGGGLENDQITSVMVDALGETVQLVWIFCH